MSIYALDLDVLLETLHTTLAERVLPGVADDNARLELHGALELLENLAPRLGWAQPPLTATIERTEALAHSLGAEPVATGLDGVARLQALRARVGEALARTYADTGAANGGEAAAAAVAAFSHVEVRGEISVGLRRGLPD